MQPVADVVSKTIAIYNTRPIYDLDFLGPSSITVAVGDQLTELHFLPLMYQFLKNQGNQQCFNYVAHKNCQNADVDIW